MFRLSRFARFAKVTRSVANCFNSKYVPKTKSRPGAIHLRIIEVLKRFPEGASGGQIRQELEKDGLRPEEQTHLDRRKRDLKKWFVIEKVQAIRETSGQSRKITLYKYIGLRKKVTDEAQIDIKTRAQVIHAAHGRCQMCGRTIEKHGVTLVLDHKKPRDLGVRTTSSIHGRGWGTSRPVSRTFSAVRLVWVQNFSAEI
jgi:hypothetical protein